MRYQQFPYSCGAACIVNALRCMGKRISERSVRVFSNTTPENGTSEEGILAALNGFGVNGEHFECSNKDEAWQQIITSNFPLICCVMNSQHWVTIIGMVNQRVILIDPTNTIANKKENGVHIMAKREFLRYWRGNDGKYFGVELN